MGAIAAISLAYALYYVFIYFTMYVPFERQVVVPGELQRNSTHDNVLRTFSVWGISPLLPAVVYGVGAIVFGFSSFILLHNRKK